MAGNSMSDDSMDMEGEGSSPVKSLGVSPASMKAELRAARLQLSAHGLMHSAKWAAEQIIGLGDIDEAATQAAAQRLPAPEVTPAEEDALALAKTYFDVREYRRAAHLLSTCASKRAVFLRGYALYLSGEKRREDTHIESAGSSGASKGGASGGDGNQELKPLYRELTDAHRDRRLDGFGLYLYGMVLKKLDLQDEARDVLAASVTAYPLNWGAWLDLASLCHSPQQAAEVAVPEHWMKAFFSAHMQLELQSNKQALAQYTALQTSFPKSQYIVSQMALASYNMRDFSEAQSAFETILAQDPYRLDNMDTYSNILYVKEQKTQLSFMAHNALRNEKYRPETCCIIGNYYSLKSQHEKAVLYFKRALQLNHHYLSAWTLMGHEFVEMRNTAAAIEAYRRALDINPRDYRAWYGLGQTYEILQMHFYSLHYFRKATALRPYDARMWCAMGQCYECLDKHDEAVKCYKRAHENGDREGIALNKLGKLYAEKMNDPQQAAVHYQTNLELLDAEQVESQQTMDALMFLAQYFKDPDLNRLDDAELYCQRLQESYAADKDEVSALMKEIRQVKQSVQAQHFSGMFSSSAMSFGGVT